MRYLWGTMPMALETYVITCPGCGARLRAREDKTHFKCPKCERQIIASKPTRRSDD